MRKNILVTGATGFIGSYLCEALLQKGHAVFGLSNSTDTQKIKHLIDQKEFHFLKGDILDLAGLNKIIKENKIEVIFHLAALLLSEKALDNPFLLFDINARGTLNLLNAAYQNKVDRFIYSSTMSVYSEPPQYLPVDEEHPTKPSTVYGVSKLEGELCCNLYSKEMKTIVLRYGGVYGKGQHQHNALFRFVSQTLNNTPITIYGSGLQTSDFVYVKDIIQANLLAMERGQSDIYNIGSGEEISIKELAEKIINLTGSKSKIVFQDAKVNRPFRFVLNIGKARKILGYSPFSFEQGLSKYVSEFTI